MKMSDWAKYGKIAWTQLQKNPAYYHTNETIQETERLRQFIRTEILGILEAKASHNVKVYLKPGEKAPKGVKVSKGARGGQYYYTKGATQGGKHMGYPKKAEPKPKPNWFNREPQKKSGSSPKGLNKWAKDQGLDPSHKDTVDAYKKEQPKKTEPHYFSQASQEKKAKENLAKDTKMMKAWIEKNRHKLPMHRIDWNKVKQNYPGLTDDQQKEYGELLLYPFHSTFSMYDMKTKFKKLSDAQLKKQNPGHTDKMNMRKKLANVFNTQGFRYYGPGDGSTDASIVAPSTNKKWYGKIRDMLDKEGLKDYRLDAAQKPGYYILKFE
jgi:hypothetical protein